MSVGLIIFVSITLRLVITIFFANEMQEIAEMKNAKKKYWWWCFLFPLMGFMLVSSLPDRENSNQLELKNVNDFSEELPRI